jgi:hypothetical protein
MIRFLFIFLIFSSTIATAQKDAVVTQDSLVVQQGPDTVLLKSYATRYSPRKALLYAAILPGLGQIYNKKYWKLPLVYGAFGYMGYWAGRYQDGYKKYKVQLFYNIENGLGENDQNPESGFSTAYLRTVTERFRRERDFMIILLGAMYVLQIVDAHVDAHLKEFDLNPNLQVSIEPLVEQNPIAGRQGGVALIIKF